MRSFFSQKSASTLLAGWLSLAGAASGHADAPSIQDIEAQSDAQAEVLSPAEAGKIFLQNAGNFVNDGIKSDSALAGRTVTADFAGGKFRVRHEFHGDGKSMTWEILAGFEQGHKGTVPYHAYDIRAGITLVMIQPLPHESVFLVIDDNRGMAAGYLGRIVNEESDRPIVMKTLRGPILESDAISPASNFESAGDLVGKRFTVTYPNNVAVYEHIYLNEHYLTWMGKKGTSAGVADTERYESIKIAPNLFLVAWNEKSAPIQISMLFDFQQKRELAAILGYDASNKRAVYQTTSAKISDIMYTESPK